MARPTTNLEGRRFGKLVVTGFAGYFPTSIGAPLDAYWTCRCDCGSEMIRVKATSLLCSNTRSCGCLRRQKKNSKHLYQKWYYEKRRGTLCDAWLSYEIFASFMKNIGYTPRMRVKKIHRGAQLSPENFCFR